MGRAVLPVCRALNCCEQTWCMYIIIVTIKYNIHNIQIWLFVVKILTRNLNLKRVELTYILSDMARRLPSTLGFCDITTLNNPSHLCLFWLLHFFFISSRKYLSLFYLEPSHVPWVAGIFQAVLVAFQEEFQEKPRQHIFYDPSFMSAKLYRSMSLFLHLSSLTL